MWCVSMCGCVHVRTCKDVRVFVHDMYAEPGNGVVIIDLCNSVSGSRAVLDISLYLPFLLVLYTLL